MTIARPQKRPSPSEASVASQEAKPHEERWNTFRFEWDAVSGVVVLGGESVQILGYKEGPHVTGKQILPGIYPDDVARLEVAFAELSPKKPTIQICCRIVHPERGVLWVETNGRAMFGTSNRMLSITGSVADMTGRMLMEKKLNTSDALLQLALEAGKSVGWDWDVKSGRDSWFGDLQTMFGIPSTTYVGHVEEFRRRVHPEDRGRVWKAVEDAMAGRAPYVAEFRVIRTDGSVRWVSAQGKFHFLFDGKPERMLGIAVDITDRKSVEEALHRKEMELTEAQRLAGVGSWQWDPETDTVLWSEELYKIAGRDPKTPAVRYKDHPQLYTAESWGRLQRAVELALQTGSPYELDMEIIQPDGNTRWVISRGEAQRDASGRVIRLRGTVQDITERKRAQEALRESEERLRLAAQAGRMYAYEWDRTSDVIVRSAEFAHILGLSKEPKEITCRQMLAAVHPDDRAKVSEATNACTPENPTCRVQYRVLHSNGAEVWLEKNGYAFFDQNGRMYRMIGMVADITDRKQAEEALSSLSRKLIEAQEAERARIARNLHDDIGQRLTVVLITLEQLNKAAQGSKDEFLDRMSELRKQIVDVSKSVNTVSHELHSAVLRHLGMAKAMRGFCVELSAKQEVEINFSLKDIPGTVNQDISLGLFRVLQEALNNAVKHSKVRHFDVELRGTSSGVSLIVRDAGVGFDPEKAMKGSGLGLISMRERLKLLNGELSVESERKSGTTIHARVPLNQGTSSARKAAGVN